MSLYVGWRVSYKNFRELLRAFRDSRLYETMDLVVLGGAPMSPGDLRLIGDWRISGAIVHIERVTDPFLAEAYARARLLAYPSLSEEFGFPPFEAMIFGCPALVCNSSSLPEVCGDAAFYYQKDDPDSLRTALLRAESDESARAGVIAGGRQVASVRLGKNAPNRLWRFTGSV